MASYQSDHLAAIVKPVAITMALASLVINITEDESVDEEMSNGMSSYMVYDESSGGSQTTIDKGSEALINAIVIIGAVCLLTFVMVLCFKYKCVKAMMGYLIFSCTMLLGYTGGFVFYTALDTNDIKMDVVTFLYLMINFAIFGVTCIFWEKSPIRYKQVFLVAISVIMVWMVSKFPEWTTWTLLLMLACYDLCAVLSPCGPLKALIKLAQERQDEEGDGHGQFLPGLLYDAAIPDRGAEAPFRRMENGESSGVQRSPSPIITSSSSNEVAKTEVVEAETKRVDEEFESKVEAKEENATKNKIPKTKELRYQTGDIESDEEGRKEDCTSEEIESKVESPHIDSGIKDVDIAGKPTMVDMKGISAPAPVSEVNSTQDASMATSVGENQTLQASNIPPEQLRRQQEQQQQQIQSSSSIKLGLGDFVFYSLLVARAAMFDIVVMACCFVAILMGLAGTIIILSMVKKALPALPISIFLATIVYFVSRHVIYDYVVDMAINSVFA
eukprot:TRINITY_DN1248_c0_g1_i1.p1 TRINITY_DN1248_c0_g1~~TRINITY_DN1248_c0_g1_i1.p1  ORF type:complete len:501 (-),score=158.95 TRINITY_DN1248_c0_g1_i1:185-1687(-)